MDKDIIAKNHDHELLKKAIYKWGDESQLNQLSEECAELIVAVNKYRRNGSINLLEEIADVEIMIAQVKILLGDYLVEVIDDWKKKKLDRLKKLLEE